MKKALLIFVLFLVSGSMLMAGSGSGESESVFMTSIPPAAPVLSAPEDGQTAVPDSVLLFWNKLDHSLGFNLQVSTVNDFSTLLVDETGITDTLYALSDLDLYTQHYWRLNAINAAGSGGFSPVWSFTTIKAAAASPVLSQPADGTSGVNPSLELHWNNVDDALSYHLQVSDQEDFSALTIDQSGIAETWYAVELDLEKTWYWRVSAVNEGGEGEFSSAWNFSTWSTGIDKDAVPKTFALLPVYPNPFNPTAFITYHLPKTSDVTLVVYNSVGQVIRTLFNGQQQAGRYTVLWDTHDNRGIPVTSGMYLCRFESTGHVFIQKMMLLR